MTTGEIQDGGLTEVCSVSDSFIVVVEIVSVVR